MTPFFGELFGTALLIILGNGVVANVVLNKTKGHNSGWIVITFGWAMAVYVAVFIAAPHSKAHLNPAVTLAFAFVKKLDWNKVPLYITAQLLGSMAGAAMVWIAYRRHFTETQSADAKLAAFCTSPAIRNTLDNLLTEIIATFVFITGILHIAAPANSLGALDALPVALLVFGIGLSLGGPTGYAINPVRDLGPRLVHFLLPLSGKRDSDWPYSWIPVIGPVIGALLAAAIFNMI
ncbi:MAG: MIP/aquaporin family protein [Chitinophagaceae bacterium]